MVKTIHSKVSPDATVLQMMQKIHKKKGIPIHEMQLSYNNRQLEEDKRLSFYGIADGTTIRLKTFSRSGDCPCEESKRMEKRVTVHVIWLQKSIKVECKLGEPVENLKDAIRKMENIPVSRQKLVFNSQDLEDHKLLASYRFGDEEAGDMDPVVYMFVDGGNPSLLDKLCSWVSFKGTKTPAPTAA